jgi:DNA-binding transcriptional MerR regulator
VNNVGDVNLNSLAFSLKLILKILAMENVTQIHHTTKEELSDVFASLLDQRIEELKESFTQRENEEYLTGKELEKILKISSVTIWSWSKKGILNPKKIGNRTYYLRSEIKGLLVKSNK